MEEKGKEFYEGISYQLITSFLYIFTRVSGLGWVEDRVKGIYRLISCALLHSLTYRIIISRTVITTIQCFPGSIRNSDIKPKTTYQMCH